MSHCLVSRKCGDEWFKQREEKTFTQTEGSILCGQDYAEEDMKKFAQWSYRYGRGMIIDTGELSVSGAT